MLVKTTCALCWLACSLVVQVVDECTCVVASPGGPYCLLCIHCERKRETMDLCREYASKVVTWLILPVVICLSQRLSHACLSINLYTVKLRMAH